MKTKILQKINSPKDIKKLGPYGLKTLAAETREFLIDSVSKTGGHLASSLGVVELTIALHYCFNLPEDKIIWDVGHQAYAHKLYTGRRDKFDSLRQLNGLGGFPKTSESDCDAFDTGHSSTSISAAFGLAMGRDLKGKKRHIAAVIGDGSLTGGLAYEGLNNVGRAKTPMIVILNDNQMSIGENVGALSRRLNEFRGDPHYIGAKRDVKGFLKTVPVIGKPINDVLEKTKDSIKYLLVPGTFFEELGFKYFGPIDGHNISDLISVIGRAKKLNCPVLLHVHTIKGKGYDYAEKNPELFHGVSPFFPETGKARNEPKGKTYSHYFCDELIKCGEEDDRVVAITASMQSGTGLDPFFERFPDRLFDVGIAEGHAVTFSGGLAKAGMIPVFACYSSFLQRGYDELIHDVCIQNLHVVFAIDRAGVVGEDGETHQGLFDLSYLSHIPNMTIMAPKNGYELGKMVRFAITEMNSPVAIRYPKGEATQIEFQDNDISYGKSETIFEGSEIALISVGCMMEQAKFCYERLVELGYSVSLINAVFVKPVDMELASRLMKFKYVFTFEDNVIIGGYGASLQLLTDKKIHVFGFKNEFIKQGKRSEIFKLNGLDGESLFERIKVIIDIQKGNDLEVRKNGTA